MVSFRFDFLSPYTNCTFVHNSLILRSQKAFSLNTRVCYDMMEDLCKTGQVSSRLSDFKGGVNLGLGTFNLVSKPMFFFKCVLCLEVSYCTNTYVTVAHAFAGSLW